jgi:hypothetical protein
MILLPLEYMSLFSLMIEQNGALLLAPTNFNGFMDVKGRD